MSATATRKSAEHYLNLRYPIMVRELAPEEGGGYVAAIPQLGIRTFVAVGETPAEALEVLDDLRRVLIPQLVAEGVELPEPRDERESIEQYSGNLVLRIPRALHAQLAAAAKRNGCSLNKLATQLLSENLERSLCIEEVRGLVSELRADAVRHQSTEDWRLPSEEPRPELNAAQSTPEVQETAKPGRS